MKWIVAAIALLLSGLAPADYLAQANGFSLAFAMIETRAALDAVDSILATPGLDGIFLGPSDLSVTLSDGASLDPAGQAVDAALAHALARVRAAHKVRRRLRCDRRAGRDLPEARLFARRGRRRHGLPTPRRAGDDQGRAGLASFG